MKQKQRIVLGVALALALLTAERYHMNLYAQTQSRRPAVQEETEAPEETEERQEAASRKAAYLTFDDGPSELTPAYLDILKKHRARATFFLIGQQIEGDMEEVVRREIREGHELGIHTYTHVSNEIYRSADSYYQDVCRVRELLQQKFQYKSCVWRFPWGSSNCYICHYKKDIVSRLHAEALEYADWNVSGEDSVGFPDSSTILANIRRNCFQVKSPVILLHDSGSNRATLEILESVLTMMEEEGYEFATISEREKYCHFGEYN